MTLLTAQDQDQIQVLCIENPAGTINKRFLPQCELPPDTDICIKKGGGAAGSCGSSTTRTGSTSSGGSTGQAGTGSRGSSGSSVEGGTVGIPWSQSSRSTIQSIIRDMV
ncbi:hypothetical protein HD806DRAFT_508779 [Xylariaceae sp. AK1471]|nr:hypothetical protein HD806DRAFT_508779 [Xylariaceae sp. AK1471]